MDQATYDKMTAMLQGRLPRDQAFLDSLPKEVKEEPKPGPKLSVIEMEKAQREYDRKVHGKEREKQLARHVEGLPDVV
jgi:hypothetical protein